jgi:leader peptidase (prepilin peptidase) / N-methyltransferase
VSPSPELPRWFVTVWSFAVGAAVGSFLNVVIARVPAGISIVRPRSRCPSCGSPIVWQDNLPVLSWLLLLGRCRRCRTRISARYPLVEILGGLAAVVATSRHGLSAAAAAELALVAALLALTFIDVDTWTLPHVITIPLLAAGILLSALHVTHAGTLPNSLAGAAAGWLGFAAVAFLGERLLKKEALGFGDVWLLSAIGAWLGLPALLPVVLLASLQGTVVGIALIVLGKAQTGEAPAPPPGEPAAGSEGPAATGEEEDWVPPRNAVPFGPFLAAGAVEWLWLQGPIVKALPVLSIFS